MAARVLGGLVLGVFVCALAFGGSRASASGVLCNVNESPCPTKSRVSVLEAALLPESQMRIGHIAAETDVLCGEAGFVAQLEPPEPEGAWSFKPSGPGACGGTGYKECAAGFERAPWEASLHATGKGNGIIEVFEGGGGFPQLKLHCVFFNIPFTCLDLREVVQLTFEGGSAPNVHEESTFKCTLGTEGIVCPGEATIEADYALADPMGAVYMAAE